MSLYPTVASLLPHRPPMLLVDAIVGEVEGGLVSRAAIREDFPFLRDGEAELVVCMELVAQTVGCFTGLVDRRRGDKPRPGLLVGCRDARFSGDPLRVGDELSITIATRWVKEPAACFHGVVDRRAARIAEVEVTVVAITDIAAAMEAMHVA
jgi:predicted hotdog family 3-hydroxylacyl-ACP dehydratase